MDNNQYVFHEDPGHGWLEVPIETIRELGLADKITPYSYMDQYSVYLEEDCDLTTFINTLKAHGIRCNPQQDFITVYEEHTPIRNMRSFDPARCRC